MVENSNVAPIAVVEASPEVVEESAPLTVSPELADSPTQDPVDDVDQVEAIAPSPEPTTKPKRKRSRKAPEPVAAIDPAIDSGESERLDALNEQLTALREQVELAENARIAAVAENDAKADAARAQWLTDNGLVKESFAILAPSVSDADPFTEEGRRVLAKFRSDNPELFKGSPDRPKVSPTHGLRLTGRRSFGEMFREATGL